MIPELFDAARHDIGVLSELHQRSFADAWSSQAIADLIATPGTFAFVVSDGFILARAAGGEAEILTLAVRPASRGQGLGRALLQAAAAHAQTLGATVLFLEVGTDNPSALALYAGQGLVRAGQRKGYYQGRDALILKAQLPLPKPQKSA